MSLIPRDLFRQDDFFAPFFGGFPFEAGALMAPQSQGAGQQLATRSMPVDVVERDTSFEVKADIPGVSKEDIHVSVDHDVLRINVENKAEKEEEKEEQGRKYHRYERSYNFVGRALRMPDNANLDEVKAKYENGVLSLEVPKKEKDAGAKRITVG
ncbi:hypothetical protein N2152v2_004252 [Parachlorella kessleri]